MAVFSSKEPLSFRELGDLLQGMKEPRAFPMIRWDEKSRILRIVTRDCSYYEQFVDTRLAILRENGGDDEIVGIELWMEDAPIIRL